MKELNIWTGLIFFLHNFIPFWAMLNLVKLFEPLLPGFEHFVPFETICAYLYPYPFISFWTVWVILYNIQNILLIY